MKSFEEIQKEYNRLRQLIKQRKTKCSGVMADLYQRANTLAWVLKDDHTGYCTCFKCWNS